MPWESFKDDVASLVERVIVSHKPSHSRHGALHNDTAYGPPRADGKVCRRVPVAALKDSQLDQVIDEELREALRR